MQDEINRPLDVATAGTRHREHKRSLGLKKSTLSDYEGYLRVHLAPFFGSTPLDEIDLEMLEAFVRAEQEEGLAPKSILNHLVLLNGIFNHALKRGWCVHNPVQLLDKPRNPRNPDIRFLTLPEVEAILAATPRNRARPNRSARLPHRGDDRDAPRRGGCDPLARHRLGYTGHPRPTQLHPWRVRNTQITPIEPRCPARRSARRGAPHALRTHNEPRRARPRLHKSSERHGSRPIEAAATVRGLCNASRRETGSLPRPPPHLRHADGRRWRPFTRCSGVAGPHRLPHHSDLRRLRPRSSPRGAIRRVGVWSETRFPGCCRAPVSEAGKPSLRCSLNRRALHQP